uniref:Uncharacterized protein n=1 Tax=Manihot esculenta TaxID=3983 RepID=A0A2C9V2P8_MANES
MAKEKYNGNNVTAIDAATLLNQVQRVRPALQRTIEVAMHFVFPISTLIHQRQLEQSPDVRSLAREGDKNRNIHGTVLGIFPIWVEVNSPIVTSHRENITRYALSSSHPFGQRIPLYLKLV